MRCSPQKSEAPTRRAGTGPRPPPAGGAPPRRSRRRARTRSARSASPACRSPPPLPPRPTARDRRGRSRRRTRAGPPPARTRRHGPARPRSAPRASPRVPPRGSARARSAAAAAPARAARRSAGSSASASGSVVSEPQQSAEVEAGVQTTSSKIRSTRSAARYENGQQRSNMNSTARRGDPLPRPCIPRRPALGQPDHVAHRSVPCLKYGRLRPIRPLQTLPPEETCGFASAAREITCIRRMSRKSNWPPRERLFSRHRGPSRFA